MSAAMITAAAVWLGCGVFTYGLALAHLQREYPTIAAEAIGSDRSAASFMAVFGPFGLLVVWFTTGAKHGLKWW